MFIAFKKDDNFASLQDGCTGDILTSVWVVEGWNPFHSWCVKREWRRQVSLVESCAVVFCSRVCGYRVSVCHIDES